MNYIDYLNYHILTYIGDILNIKDLNINYNELPELYVIYIKIATLSFNLSLIIFILLFIFNFIFFIFFKQNSFSSKLFFYINIISALIVEMLAITKFYLSIKVEGSIKELVLRERLKFYNANKDVEGLEHFIVFSSSFSDVILLLSLIVGLFCLDILGPKNYFKYLNNNSLFYTFNILVIIMVNTNNLLIMFICFEFIFLPTVFFAYKFGYSKKIDNASLKLFTWTLFGSFLVLCGLLYLYNKHNTLNYLNLSEKKFSIYEKRFIFCLFLFGFSIKIPLAPLHHWLLKVHVESPTAYSIFLSGFLVKSALYCLSTLLQHFYPGNEFIPALVWFFYSMLVGTIGMARQTDIKRLIAWCTVQEMSFIVMFWGVKQIYVDKCYLIFILIHGLLSTYMFFLIDIIQRRFKTRNILAITGLNVLSPHLVNYIWFLIFVFSGFPLTAKFIIEWNFFCLLWGYGLCVMLFMTLGVTVLGVIVFSKIFFNLMYGTPKNVFEPITVGLQKREVRMLNTIIFMTVSLTFLMYTI